MFCTNCGTANKDDAKFCIHCGDSLTETVIKKKPLRERLFKKAGFFQALLDFSFNQFVISKVIKFLYGLSILYAGLIAFIFVILGLNVLKGLGIFVIIIGAPLIFLLTVIYSRMLLETIIVISRIADYLAEIVRKSESKDSIHWNI
jgi:hypothetical protein